MKCRTIIDPTREEEVIIYAHEKTALTDNIESMVMSLSEEIVGYSDREEIKTLSASEVYCCVTEGGKVFALTERGRFEIKMRLYMLEEKFGAGFVKINQSCIVNVDKIERFKVSIGGALLVILKNGYKDYVSRRQLKAVKQRVGL